MRHGNAKAVRKSDWTFDIEAFKRQKERHWCDARPEPAAAPTDTSPGSEERMEVYRQRFENDQELFHADDAWI